MKDGEMDKVFNGQGFHTNLRILESAIAEPLKIHNNDGTRHGSLFRTIG